MAEQQDAQRLIDSLDNIGHEIRALRHTIESMAMDVAPPRYVRHPRTWSHHGAGFAASAEFGCHARVVKVRLAIWIYIRGNWQLDHHSIPEGVDPGPPPNIRGSYEGQCVKTVCP